MKFVRKWMLKIHRLLGAVLSVCLLVWFLSGFVMMYHSYPSWGREEAVALSQDLSLDLGQFDVPENLSALLGDLNTPCQIRLSYEPAYGTHYDVRKGGERQRYDLHGDLLPNAQATPALFAAVAAMWQDSVLRVDTIAELDQWTPFYRLREDLPFFRLTLGKEGRQVYISGRDARLLTEHTRVERVWSWLGPIPHWVYFTQLRQDRDLWTWVIILLSGLGTLMLLGGIYVGVDVYLRTRKSMRGMHSPYTKPAYRWHHVLGTLCGVFMLLWCFSGLMSVVDVSSSLNDEETERVREYFRPKSMLPLTMAAQAEVLKPRLKELLWTSCGSIPVLRAAYVRHDASIKYEYWSSNGLELSPLGLSEQEVRAELEQAFPKGTGYNLELLTAYDDYYLSTSGALGLPVYRVRPEDNRLPYIYLNPKSGDCRVFSRSERIRMWLYNKPHSLRFVTLAEYPVLRQLIMWLLLGLGTIVSATGLLLGIRYLRRML